MATYATPKKTTPFPAPVRDFEYRHPVEVSWKSILAGVVTGLAIWGMLYTLGVAVGLTTIDPAQPAESLRTSGIFSGIWTLIVPIVALFVGGWVAGRGAGAVTRGEGALHGLVTWALSILIGAWLATNVVGSAVALAAQLRGGFHSPGAMGGGDLTSQLETLNAAGSAFWSLFGSIFLAMLASLAGAALGVSRQQRREATAPISGRPVHAHRDLYEAPV